MKSRAQNAMGPKARTCRERRGSGREGRDRKEADGEDEEKGSPTDNGADDEDEARVGHDEDADGEHGAKVLADEVFASADGSGRGWEERLLLEFSVEGGRANDDGHGDAEERDGRAPRSLMMRGASCSA